MNCPSENVTSVSLATLPYVVFKVLHRFHPELGHVYMVVGGYSVNAMNDVRRV